MPHPTQPSPSLADLPEELKVQTGFGQEELVVLLEPDFTHSSVLEQGEEKRRRREREERRKEVEDFFR